MNQLLKLYEVIFLPLLKFKKITQFFSNNIKSMKNKVSVIVPIYNTEKYLKQCIKSILSQSYENIELILVNDASPDKSLAICENFLSKDLRVRLINKTKNEGLSRARFSGLAASTGTYIMWVDSDDWLEPDILSLMVDTIQKEKVDYVEVASQRVWGSHKLKKIKNISPVLGTIKQPQLFDDYYISFFGVNILSVNAWGKLYKKETLMKANLNASPVTLGEDLYLNLHLFPFLNGICILDKIGYNYRLGGMTSHYNPRLYPDLLSMYLLKEELIEKYHYSKAKDYLRIELKNVLISDICQMIFYHIADEQAIKSIILEKISAPLWERALIVNKTEYCDNPYVMAIREKNVDLLYDLCYAKLKKNRLKFLIKKLLVFLS